jgi:hypothetical protein
MGTSLYKLAGGALAFDDIFEPVVGNNGATDASYRAPNGTLLSFAARSLGGQAQATQYQRTGGAGDVNTLWAAKGTVSYLQALTFNGAAYFQACWAVAWSNQMYCDTFLNFLSNGTWTITSVTTNYVTDDVPAYAAYGGYDYSGGQVIAAGNWSTQVVAGIGANYKINMQPGAIELGWINFYDTAADPSYNAGSLRGQGPNTLQASQVNGIGNARSLSSTQSMGLVLQAQGSNGGSSYADANDGLSWYNRCTLNVTVYSIYNSAIQVSGTFTPLNQIRWGPSSYPTVTHGPPPPAPAPAPAPSGGGGGGGGGGGCVAVEMYLQPELIAANAYKGMVIDGVAYNPDRVYGREITDIRFMTQPCLRMVTESGIELIASTTTPMTMPDGSCLMFPEMLHQQVLVDDNGDIRWEQVVTLENAGDRMVALISMNDQNYFAGTNPLRRIGSHNMAEVK